jgi:hypothetical protein
VLRVWCSLPQAAPARLELLDIVGRRVLSREVGDLGAGRHQIELRSGSRLAAGVYVLRLTQGGRSVTAKAVVVN